MNHPEPHPQRGQVIHLLVNGPNLIDFEVEDWADRVDSRYADDPDGDDLVYGHCVDTEPPLARLFRNADLQVHHVT